MLSDSRTKGSKVGISTRRGVFVNIDYLAVNPNDMPHHNISNATV